MRFPGTSGSGDSRGDGQEPVAVFKAALEEKSLCAGLYNGIRGLFPSKLPPLELTSTPVAVHDRMSIKTNRWAVGTSTIVKGGVLAIVCLLGMRAALPPVSGSRHPDHITLSDLPIFAPHSGQARGGGGGGSNDIIDAVAGRQPRFETAPLAPPQVPRLEDPRLKIDAAIAVPPEIKLPDNLSLPDIGVHTSTNITLLSNGPGTEAGMGAGAKGGIGPGKGNGYGPGFEHGTGTGVYQPGVGGVTNPVAIVSPEAEFSDEARRAKYQGVCMISIIVDANGYPQNPRVVRSLGMGLDEKALDAVRRYRFKPAMKNGKPVPAMITVEVDFRLY